MTTMKQPAHTSRHHDASTQTSKRRSSGFTLGLAAFQKVSAVEGIEVSDGLVADLRTMAGKHSGENERTRYINAKYGKT